MANIRNINSLQYCLTIAAITLSSLNLLGQTTNFVHYDTEDGLPQSQVQTIQQDDDGNLWIGTMSGLAKYNGRDFENFTKNDSLAEDWITTSYKDKAGNIWLGHWGGGVSKYIFKSKTFVNLDFDIISQFNPISVIYEDSDGNFWFGTDGGGIYRYDLNKNTVYVITTDEELSGDYVTSICEDNEGNIWIGTNNGITIYNSKQAINAEEAYAYLNIEKGLVNNKISAIIKALEGEMWIGTEDAGVVVLKMREEMSIMELENIHDAISANLTVDEGLSSNSVNVIYEDRDHSIWIGTDDGGVTQFIPSEGERSSDEDLTKGIFNRFSTEEGLNYHKVNAIFQDREGNFWIGTEVGINKYRGDRFKLFDESDGLINNIVWSVMEDSKGNLWLGTNSGVSVISASDEITKGFQVQNYSTSDGLAENIVLSI